MVCLLSSSLCHALTCSRVLFQVMMEKSVSSMNAQVEALRRSITQATKETDELTRQKAEVIAELASERENAQERRRQMKVRPGSRSA